MRSISVSITAQYTGGVVANLKGFILSSILNVSKKKLLKYPIICMIALSMSRQCCILKIIEGIYEQ